MNTLLNEMLAMLDKFIDLICLVDLGSVGFYPWNFFNLFPYLTNYFA
jgi:hypothetical protein